MTTASLSSQFGNIAAVCIARGVPRAWHGRVYHDLAPTRAMLAMSWADYDVAFDAILALRNPAKVLADLGRDAVLCCYEPPRVARCHRRRVAEWLEDALGIEIPEIGYSRAETPAYADMPAAPPKRKKPPSRQIPLGL